MFTRYLQENILFNHVNSKVFVLFLAKLFSHCCRISWIRAHVKCPKSRTSYISVSMFYARPWIEVYLLLEYPFVSINFTHLSIVFWRHRAFIFIYLKFSQRQLKAKHWESKTLNVLLSFSNEPIAQVFVRCRVGRQCFASEWIIYWTQLPIDLDFTSVKFK